MRILYLLAVVLGLLAGAAHADMLELDSCTDARGNIIPGEADSSLGVVVGSAQAAGKRVIRYNPDLLPNLSGAARQFFFAHECARLALGERPGTKTTPDRARRADCLGVATLQASGLLKDASALAGLQAELVFTDEEWDRLPGPRRSFDLAACPKQNVVVLPRATPPTPGQLEWDACIRRCGDQLFRCRGDCQAGFDRCRAGCKAD